MASFTGNDYGVWWQELVCPYTFSCNTLLFHFPFRAFQDLSEDFGTSAGILRPIYVQGDLQD